MVHGPYNFLMSREPECPYCRRVLLPVATMFNHGTAFCQACYDLLHVDVVSQIIATQDNQTLGGLWTNTRGLYFFTPHGLIALKSAAHLIPAWIRAQDLEPPPSIPREPHNVRRTAINEPPPR